MVLPHDQPPILPQLGRYPEAKRSEPYAITVINPQPSLAEGTATVYQFAVDDPFPRFDMPLGADNTLPAARYNLGEVYNVALAAIPTIARKVDYARQPLQADTYSMADRQRIADRMLMLHFLIADGVNVEDVGAVPIDRGRLDAYLASLTGHDAKTDRPAPDLDISM